MMIITFNDRKNPTKGGSYFRKDFERGIAQEAGLSMPSWFEGDRSLLAKMPPSYKDFRALLANRHPVSGERLTLRHKTTRLEKGKEVANRRLDFELTFNFAKSVSIMGVLVGDRRILTAVENTVWSVLVVAVGFAAARVRKRGAECDRLTKHLLALLLYDIVSREGDPHLHAHVAFPNVTFDPVEACYKALQFGLIHKHLPLLELWGNAAMKQELLKIGYEIEGNEIKGISQEVKDKFSKCTVKIEKAIAKKEDNDKQNLTPDQKKVLALRIRSKKERYDYLSLLAKWKAELGLDSKSLEAVYQNAKSRVAIGMKLPDAMIAATKTIEQAIENLTQEMFVVTDEQILSESLKHAVGEWAGPHLNNALHRLKNSGKILPFCDTGTFGKEHTFNRMADLAESITATKNAAAPILNSFIAVPERQKALAELMTSRDPVVVIGTNLSPECIAMTRTLINTFKGVVSYSLPSDVAGGEKFKLKEVLGRLERNTPTRPHILIVSQAEKLSMVELEQVVIMATSGARRVILIASQKALQNVNDHRPMVVLNRLSWLQQIVFTPPKTSTPDRWRRLINPTFVELVKNLLRRGKDIIALLDKRCDPIHSVAVASVALLTDRRRSENVAILADDSSQIFQINETIYRLLHSDETELTYDITAYESIPHFKNLSLGDTLFAPLKTRHFQQGDVLIVDGINNEGGVLSLPNGDKKQFTTKVLRKLKRIKPYPLKMSVGIILELTEPLPALKFHTGDRVQIESVDASGIITIQGGKELPPWFHFFRLGYCTPIQAKARQKAKATLLVLSKRPNKEMKEVINKLADDADGNLRIIALSPKALPASVVNCLQSTRDFTHDQMRAFQIAQPVEDILTEPEPEPVAEPQPLFVADPVQTVQPVVATKQPRLTQRPQPTIEI